MYKQYEKIDIAKDVKKETAWEIQMKSSDLPGITDEAVPIRYYPNGEVGSACLGYLGKISNADKYKGLGYDISKELIGVSGLEYALENRENNKYGIQLRGEPSIDYLKVDKYGKPISEAAKLDAIPGDSVRTTINEDVQAAAEKALDETMAKIRAGGFGQKYNATRGAVVAMDINTGEILALASRPGYDPNYFAETGLPQDPAIVKKYLLDNPKILTDDKYDSIARPLFNYAAQGAVMPGSTFKPFTAIAGLEEGVINKNTIVFDDGIWNNLPGIHIKEWTYNTTGRGFGSVNVEDALKLSSNYFFNQVGYLLGFEKFSEWANKFGLVRGENGEKPSTGIEIPENPGSVGTPEESKKRAASSAMKDIVETLKDYRYGGFTIDYGTVYYSEIYEMLANGNYDEKKLQDLGVQNKKALKYIKNKINYIKKFAVNKIDVLNMAMGQGYVSLTPIQMAQYLSTILNGGTRYKAHLIKEVLNPDGTVKEEIQPEILNKINLNPENVAIIKEGMGKVTDETGGTASSLFRNYPIKTGGKTGTAEPGSGEITNYRDNYGWFVSFAPFDKPEIAVAAVIYDGGHGVYSGNVVKAVYDAYFKDQPQMKAYLDKMAQNKTK
jgi:penicillin-binding protein 2